MPAVAKCQKPDREPAGFDRVAEQTRIKLLLAQAGFTLADVDKIHDLTQGMCRNAMRVPSVPAERAIAAVLKTHPHLLWPSRYRPNGQRRKPLDWSRVPTLAQRRKGDAHLAVQGSSS